MTDGIQHYSTTRQRSQEDSKRIAGAVLVLFLVILLALITGCAGTLDKAIATCYALDGGPTYTKAEGVEKFACDRPTTLTATRGR